jgi:hypothetical protein
MDIFDSLAGYPKVKFFANLAMSQVKIPGNCVSVEFV